MTPANVTFSNPSGGAWDNDMNWTDNQGVHRLPGQGDTAVINLNGIAVMFSSDMPALVTGLTLSGRNSSLEVKAGALHVSGTLAISNTFTTTVDGGTLEGQTKFTATGSTLEVDSGTVSAPGDNLTVSGGSTLRLYGGTVPYTTTVINLDARAGRLVHDGGRDDYCPGYEQADWQY